MDFENDVPAEGNWNINKEGERLIITSKDKFRCFINRAYDVRSGTSVISAHMVLYANNHADLADRLRFWNPDTSEPESRVLSGIFDDLRAVDARFA